MGKKLIDETGNIYGALKVIKPVREPGMRKTMWLCQCSCGEQKIFNGSELRAGKRTSCGKHCNNYKDESNKIYGFLKVIKQDETPAKNFPDRCIHWICECQLCGSIVSVSGRNLRNGDTQSCGCSKSMGEQYIAKFFSENNDYFYQKEYQFEELKGDYKPLRFDFAIFDKCHNLKCLIEFNGTQHYKENSYFQHDAGLKKRQEYDKLKQDFCLENKINLYIISNEGNFHNELNERLLVILQYIIKDIKGEKRNGKISYLDLRNVQS
jgi:hypothetical protein